MLQVHIILQFIFLFICFILLASRNEKVGQLMQCLFSYSNHIFILIYIYIHGFNCCLVFFNVVGLKTVYNNFKLVFQYFSSKAFMKSFCNCILVLLITWLNFLILKAVIQQKLFSQLLNIFSIIYYEVLCFQSPKNVYTGSRQGSQRRL